MKKIILFILFSVSITAAHAQTDTTSAYLGKYTFPDGSPVTEITVVLENGMLMANSAIGNSELKRIDKDVYEIIVYAGTATFRRNSEGKVTGLHILVGDVNMEGVKIEAP